MTDLITLISSGSGTIPHVLQVIEGEQWENIYVLASEEYKSQVPQKENLKIIEIDRAKMLPDLIEQIKEQLKDKVSIVETAVNIISGDGKEHMALLSALLQLGAGVRFVALTKEGVKSL